MDFLDDEATPEERQAALVQVLRARMGQGQPQAADFYRGQGNLALQSGDRVLGGFGQAQLQQAGQLGAQSQQARQFGLGQALTARREKLGQDFQAGEHAKNRAATRQNLLDELGARERAAKEKAEGDKKSDGLKVETDLRNKLLDMPETKDAMKVAGYHRGVMKATPNGAGDIGLLYNYLHVVEPGSAVKEGEFAQAGKAGGLPSSVQGLFNQLTAKGFLTDDVRRQIKAESANLLKSRLEGYGKIQESFRGLANQYGADPSRVVVPLGLEMEESPAQGGSFDVGQPVIKNGKKFYPRPDGTWEVEE